MIHGIGEALGTTDLTGDRHGVSAITDGTQAGTGIPGTTATGIRGITPAGTMTPGTMIPGITAATGTVLIIITGTTDMPATGTATVTRATGTTDTVPAIMAEAVPITEQVFPAAAYSATEEAVWPVPRR